MSTRRKFLKSLVLGTGGLSFRPPVSLFRHLSRMENAQGPRAGRGNPFVNARGQPKLVNISGSDVPTMLRKGLLALGGLKSLIRSNDTVLIKPNLVLRESDPAAALFPTMSSPETIRELIYLVRNFTYTVQVGDQGGEDQEAINTALDLANAVVGAGAELLNFENSANPTCTVRHPLWQEEIPDFEVYRGVYEASVIISLCNLKRHSSAFMTCAIKNNFGAMQGRWSSGTRAFLHRHPNLSSAFIEELPYVAALIRPELTIVDARDIMIGSGPILSSPGAQIRSGVNRMVFSGDLVALDAYCGEKILQRYDPEFAITSIGPTLQKAEQLGLGTSDLNKVEVLEIDETWEPPPKKGAYRR